MGKRRIKELLNQYLLKDLTAIVIKLLTEYHRPDYGRCVVRTCLDMRCLWPDDKNLYKHQYEHGNIVFYGYTYSGQGFFVCFNCKDYHDFKALVKVPPCVLKGIEKPSIFYNDVV